MYSCVSYIYMLLMSTYVLDMLISMITANVTLVRVDNGVDRLEVRLHRVVSGEHLLAVRAGSFGHVV
jgi:hypothetical protein